MVCFLFGFLSDFLHLLCCLYSPVSPTGSLQCPCSSHLLLSSWLHLVSAEQHHKPDQQSCAPTSHLCSQHLEKLLLPEHGPRKGQLALTCISQGTLTGLPQASRTSLAKLLNVSVCQVPNCRTWVGGPAASWQFVSSWSLLHPRAPLVPTWISSHAGPVTLFLWCRTRAWHYNSMTLLQVRWFAAGPLFQSGIGLRRRQYYCSEGNKTHPDDDPAFIAIWRGERKRQYALNGSKDSSTYFCMCMGGLTNISAGLLRVLEENPWIAFNSSWRFGFPLRTLCSSWRVQQWRPVLNWWYIRAVVGWEEVQETRQTGS